jgi:hypothetical protein
MCRSLKQARRKFFAFMCNLHKNMVAERNLYLAFSSIMIINDPFEPGVSKLV